MSGRLRGAEGSAAAFLRLAHDHLKQVGAMRFDFDGQHRVIGQLALSELEKPRCLLLALRDVHGRARGREVGDGAERRICGIGRQRGPPVERNLLLTHIAGKLCHR